MQVVVLSNRLKSISKAVSTEMNTDRSILKYHSQIVNCALASNNLHFGIWLVKSLTDLTEFLLVVQRWNKFVFCLRGGRQLVAHY